MGDRMVGDQPQNYSLTRNSEGKHGCYSDSDRDRKKAASYSSSWPSSPSCSKSSKPSKSPNSSWLSSHSSNTSSNPSTSCTFSKTDLTPRFSGMSLNDMTKVIMMQEMDKLEMTNDKALDLSLPTTKLHQDKK